MKKKLFSLLTLLLIGISGAWATGYTPSADEVIILNEVYSSSATTTGYSTHSAIAWGSTASSNSKKAGDPYNGGAATSSNVNCYSVKGNNDGKSITVNITGVSKIIVYHESHASRYVELRSGGKSGTLIGKGSASTYYTEVSLSGTTDYSIFLHGTTGTDDQDLYVYAIKLIKAAVAPGAIGFDPAAGSVETGSEITLASTGATTIVYQWSSSAMDKDSDWSDASTYAANAKPTVPAYGSSNNVLSVKATNTNGSTYGSATYTIVAAKTATTTEITAASIAALNTDIKTGTAAGTLAATVTPDGASALASPTITWSSSVPGVATINENTGAITLVAEGTTTIRASYAGDEAYSASYDEYDLTVTDTRKSVTLSFSSTSIVDYNYDGETLTAPTLTAKDGENQDIDLSDLPELTFTKSGDIVTVNATTGAITAANTNNFGSSTVTAAFAGNADYKAATSTTYTVSRAPMLYQVKFDNGFEGFIEEGTKKVKVYYMAGTSAPSQTGSIKKADGFEAAVSGGNVVLTKDTHTKTYEVVATAVTPFEGAGKQNFTAVPSYVASVYGYDDTKKLKFSKKANLDETKTDWTREAKGNSRLYFFVGAATNAILTEANVAERNIEVYVNGVKDGTITKIEKNGTITIALNDNALNMIEIQSNQTSGDGGFKDITLTAPKKSVTVGANGYTTFASTSALDLTDENRPDGLKAYKATREGANVSFEKLNQTVPAGTGLLLLGETKGGTYYIPVAASGDDITTDLIGVTTATAKQSNPEGNYYFVMKKAANADSPLAFAPLSTESEVTIPAGKAYIEVPNADLTSARALTISFDDEGNTTGIVSVGKPQTANDTAVYNIAGQRVAQPTKGLYIVNGKKVIVK